MNAGRGHRQAGRKMRKALGAFLLGGRLALAAAAESNTPGFQVVYFPEAVVRGERAVFEIDAAHALEIEARLNGTRLDRKTVPAGRTQWALALADAGPLVFSDGVGERVFAVVAPQTEAGIETRGGFLHADRTPAILMADERAPPKPDRRWQTLFWLWSRAAEVRMPARSGTLLLSPALFPEQTSAEVEDALGADGFWRVHILDLADSEIHALIEALGAGTPNDILVIALSDHDVQRGEEWIRYRIKLEWLLQRVESLDCRKAFLVAPPLDAPQAQRWQPWLRGLRRAVERHEVVGFFPPPARDLRMPLLWQGFLHEALEAHVLRGGL